MDFEVSNKSGYGTISSPVRRNVTNDDPVLDMLSIPSLWRLKGVGQDFPYVLAVLGTSSTRLDFIDAFNAEP